MRLVHVHFNLINKIIFKDLVTGLTKIIFSKDKIYDECQIGKQTRVSFKPKICAYTNKSLKLLHLNLFGTSMTTSLEGNYDNFKIVDDYIRFT